ncbi:hypothetical protein RchiOBHm_Chr6g0290471 [Rosa chinensis]|uniref:Thionin-like protein n=1 Tax=Rosa chinensis TaxID=74649 RepID=A0A2P6PVW0_ROSCH|nr:hypothetical protein RchiOBHm_Chr6g0290471 [Rosa chinensis]
MAKKLLAVFLTLVVVVAVHTWKAEAADKKGKNFKACEAACLKDCEAEDGVGRITNSECKMKCVGQCEQEKTRG